MGLSNDLLARRLHNALNKWMARRAPASNFQRREWDEMSDFERDLFFWLAENVRDFIAAERPKALPAGNPSALHNDNGLFDYVFGTDSLPTQQIRK